MERLAVGLVVLLSVAGVAGAQIPPFRAWAYVEDTVVCLQNNQTCWTLPVDPGVEGQCEVVTQKLEFDCEEIETELGLGPFTPAALAGVRTTVNIDNNTRTTSFACVGTSCVFLPVNPGLDVECEIDVEPECVEAEIQLTNAGV